jgi:hypothetical protein
LAYPVPGVIDHEDIAVTGAGGSEKAVSWLYDFEEQEGEIDFLSRVVVFTFYSGPSCFLVVLIKSDLQMIL